MQLMAFPEFFLSSRSGIIVFQRSERIYIWIDDVTMSKRSRLNSRVLPRINQLLLMISSDNSETSWILENVLWVFVYESWQIAYIWMQHSFSSGNFMENRPLDIWKIAILQLLQKRGISKKLSMDEFERRDKIFFQIKKRKWYNRGFLIAHRIFQAFNYSSVH